MSGSSLDGLDLALVEFSPHKSGTYPDWKFLECDTVAYPSAIVERLAGAPAASARELFKLESDYSQHVAEVVTNFLGPFKIRPAYIGWHGHTVFHNPEHQSTLQIGHGAALAGVTGIPTISDFRTRDLYLGGQGAPLAPLADAQLLQQADYFVNLGGICNASYRTDDHIVSGDISACNQILNHLSKQLGLAYDQDGVKARAGSDIASVLQNLNALSYHKAPLPKSMDNSWVTQEVLPLLPIDSIGISDLLHTGVSHIVTQLRSFLEQHPTTSGGTMICTGGGAKNIFLMDRIRNMAGHLDIQLLEPTPDLIDFKEALLMAYMAYGYIHGIPNVLASATGASEDHVGGSLYMGQQSIRIHA